MPALNEAEPCGATSRRARRGRRVADGGQVVVSDGGSTDATLEVARALGAQTVSGRPAAAASSPRRGGPLRRHRRRRRHLLFLHADTELPPAAEAVRARSGGRGRRRFRLRFESTGRCSAGRPPDQPALAAGFPRSAIRRSSCPRRVSRQGGFRDWPSWRTSISRCCCGAGAAPRCSRRGDDGGATLRGEGAVRTVATNWLIWLLSCSECRRTLARLYRQIR